MKKLNKKVTSLIFKSENSYRELESYWSSLVNSKDNKLTPTDFLLYQILRGKDYTRSFSLPTNKRKLDNGYLAGWKMFFARSRVKRMFQSKDIGAFNQFIRPEAYELLNTIVTSLFYTWEESYQLNPVNSASLLKLYTKPEEIEILKSELGVQCE